MSNRTRQRTSTRAMFLGFVLIAMYARCVAAQVVQPVTTSSDQRVAEIRFKLKIVGHGVLMHHETLKSLPPPRDRTGKADGNGLSWRVHLLPFVGEHELYEEFRFDEAWDSPHNSKLLDRMPDVYRLDGLAGSTTRFRVFSGANLLFGSQVSLRAIQDGAAHTMLVIVAARELATPWTKPDELQLESLDPAMFRESSGTSIECIMADGQLLTLPADIEAKTLAALVTPNGGEIVDATAIRRRTAGDTAALGNSGQSMQADPTVQKKLKEIVLAMHNYHDVNKSFPVRSKPEYFDAEGQPKLSWRVHLLPFLQQRPLYERFRLDEAWDSPHNRALLPLIPEVYRDEGLGEATRFVTIQGEFALFGNKKTPKMADVRDGTTHTILVVQTGTDKSIAWTKPDDNYFDPTRPFDCVGSIGDNGLACVMVDGAVWVFRRSLSAEVFSALVTPRGNEVINANELSSARIR